MAFVRVKGCKCPSLDAHYRIFPRLISDLGAISIRLTGAQLPAKYCLTSLLPEFDANMAEQLYNEAGPVELCFSYMNIGTYEKPFTPVEQSKLDHIVYYQDRVQLDRLYFTNRIMIAYGLNSNGRRVPGHEYIAFPVSNSLFRWVTADSFGRFEHDRNCYECTHNTMSTSIRCIVPHILGWEAMAPARSLAELDSTARRTFVPPPVRLTFGTAGCMLKRTDLVVNCYSQAELSALAGVFFTFAPTTSLTVSVPNVESTNPLADACTSIPEVVASPAEGKPSSSQPSSSTFAAAPGIEAVQSEDVTESVTTQSPVGVIVEDMSAPLSSVATDVESPMDIEVSTAATVPGDVSSPVPSPPLVPTSAQPSGEAQGPSAGTKVAKRVFAPPPPESLYGRMLRYKADCKTAKVVPFTDEANLVVPNPFPEFSRRNEKRTPSPYPDYSSSSSSEKSLKNIPEDYVHRKALQSPFFIVGAQGQEEGEVIDVGVSSGGSPPSGSSIPAEKRQATSPGSVPSSKRVSTGTPTTAATDPQLCRIWSEVSVGFDLQDLYGGEVDPFAAAGPSTGEQPSTTAPADGGSAQLPGTPESCYTEYSSRESSQVYHFPTSSSSTADSDRIRLTDEEHMRLVWGVELEYREGHQPAPPVQQQQVRAPRVQGQDLPLSALQEDRLAWMAIRRQQGSLTSSSLESTSHSTSYLSCDSESDSSSSFSVDSQSRAEPPTAGVLSTVAHNVPSFLRNVFGRVLGIIIPPAAPAPAGDAGVGDRGE